MPASSRDVNAPAASISRDESEGDLDADALQRMSRQVADSIARGADDSDIAELVLALGRLKDQRALEFLASLGGHASTVVRRAVAEALPLAMVVPEDSSLGVDVLLSMFDDDDAVIRDWAVCSLGRTLAGVGDEVPAPFDTARIRAALTVRVYDEDPATRAEACAGLALRHVVEVVGPLRLELELPGVGRVPVIAAKAIGSPVLHESLVALRSWWTRDPELLERAIEACSPRK